MTEQIEPDTGLTESTRQMYTEKYAETFKSFVDEVLLNKPPTPKPVDHSILLDELALLKEKYLKLVRQCKSEKNSFDLKSNFSFKF